MTESPSEPAPGEDPRPTAAASRVPDLWHPLYLLLIQEAEDLHTVVDREGRFEFVNGAVESLLGIPASECIGRSAFEWLQPSDPEQARKTFQEWIESGSRQPIRFENRHVRPDGTPRELAWTVFPCHDESGEVVGFASTARDITERRQTERELQRSEAIHRALLEGLLDPAVAIDDRGIIQHASLSVENVFGYVPSALIGRNISMLMPEPYRSEHDGYLDRYRQTGKTNILGSTREFRAVRKDGVVIDVELSVARVDVEPQHGPMFIGCFRDVTERKRAQLAENSMLRALAVLGESSAMLAHEIKTPVTAVHMALRAVARSLGEDERQILEDLVRRLKRLEQQMRQTLSFAKPIALRIRSCEARELFKEVVRTQQPILDGAGITTEIDAPDETPTFEADYARLLEVLTNLLVNSVEMLARGGCLRLSARADGADQVCLRVEDDGPGISGTVAGNLFKPFVTTKEEGTGLGLPICRRIIEEHGGTIEVEVSDLGGACFSIRLPLQSPVEQDALDLRGAK